MQRIEHQMERNAAVILAALVLAALAQTASASFIIEQSLRYTQVCGFHIDEGYETCETDTAASATGAFNSDSYLPAPFSYYGVWAYQESNISNTALSGTVWATSTYIDDQGLSFFEVFFAIEDPTSILLNVVPRECTWEAECDWANSRGSSIFERVDPVTEETIEILLSDGAIWAGDAPISYASELAAGLYHLEILNRGGISSMAAGKTVLDFSLTIIPEPGTAPLLGLGLVGLVVAARRRSN